MGILANYWSMTQGVCQQINKNYWSFLCHYTRAREKEYCKQLGTDFDQALCSRNNEKIILENRLKKKLFAISLWNSTVQRRISDIAVNIKDQVVKETKFAALTYFQFILIDWCGVMLLVGGVCKIFLHNFI